MTTMDVEELNPDQDIDFCTLGMFILDEIQYPPPKPPQYDVLGGAGSYSALGARLVSPSPIESKKVGWIVDRGSDFPPKLSDLIISWQTSCLLRTDLSRLTTRGWNGYTGTTQYRSFRYTTPKLRLEHSDLLDSPVLLSSKSFHLICSPDRCINLVTNILSLRRRSFYPLQLPKPLFIWEPVPDQCVPNELLNTTAALGYVDVCSPNHADLGQLMGCSGEHPDGSVDRAFVEEGTEMLLASMPLSSVAVIVRCGADGCYIGQNGGRTQRSTSKPKSKSKRGQAPPKSKKVRGGGLTLNADIDMMALFAGISFDRDIEDEDESAEGGGSEVLSRDYGLSTWIPPYHTNADKVVDPTGGGNAFLGAMTVAHARGKSLEEAARWGSVAASLAIEQVGMPVLSVDENGAEKWNGVDVRKRLEEFEKRCGAEKPEAGGVELASGMAQVAIKEVSTKS